MNGNTVISEVSIGRAYGIFATYYVSKCDVKVVYVQFACKYDTAYHICIRLVSYPDGMNHLYTCVRDQWMT